MHRLRRGPGVRRQPQVWISGDSAELMIRLSREGYPHETGGVLVGHASPYGLVVTHATGAGPDAEQRQSTFRRDGEFTQEAVDGIFAATGGQSDYLGEWHSHPWPAGPSVMDRQAMAWISRSPVYRTPEPLLVIVQRSRWRRWRLLGFRWAGGDLHPTTLLIVPNERLLGR
jgi:integrative and conjugative element protein (TIGR02256 family)